MRLGSVISLASVYNRHNWFCNILNRALWVRRKETDPTQGQTSDQSEPSVPLANWPFLAVFLICQYFSGAYILGSLGGYFGVTISFIICPTYITPTMHPLPKSEFKFRNGMWVYLIEDYSENFNKNICSKKLNIIFKIILLIWKIPSNYKKKFGKCLL